VGDLGDMFRPLATSREQEAKRLLVPRRAGCCTRGRAWLRRGPPTKASAAARAAPHGRRRALPGGARDGARGFCGLGAVGEGIARGRRRRGAAGADRRRRSGQSAWARTEVASDDRWHADRRGRASEEKQATQRRACVGAHASARARHWQTAAQGACGKARGGSGRPSPHSGGARRWCGGRRRLFGFQVAGCLFAAPHMRAGPRRSATGSKGRGGHRGRGRGLRLGNSGGRRESTAEGWEAGSWKAVESVARKRGVR
jgi:hypothetical protein